MERWGGNYEMPFWLRRRSNKRHMRSQVALQVLQQPKTLETYATLLPLPPLLVTPYQHPRGVSVGLSPTQNPPLRNLPLRMQDGSQSGSLAVHVTRKWYTHQHVWKREGQVVTVVVCGSILHVNI